VEEEVLAAVRQGHGLHQRHAERLGVELHRLGHVAAHQRQVVDAFCLHGVLRLVLRASLRPDQNSSTIFPKCSPPCMAVKAALASIHGNTLSTTGPMRCSSISLHMASNMSREPTERPCSLAELPIRAAGLKPEPGPATTPTMAMWPPILMAFMLCSMVPPPPTSMIRSAPTPPVASRT